MSISRALPIMISSAALALAVSCGGGQQGQKTEGVSGTDDLDETTTKPVDSVGDGSGTAAGTSDGEGNGSGTAAGDGDGDGGDGDGDGSGSAAPTPTGPAVTIKIKNTWTKDLEFNLDAGWGGQILVFSGKPPNAVSILPFAKACTASCDANPADRCPVCKKPESLGQIRKAEKRETVEAGKDLEISWDSKVHVYEKTKGKRRSCNCHRLAPVPPATYTVRVCGLRLSKKHRKHSKLQCETKEDALTFPADGPQVLEFEFGDPSKKK